MVEVTCWMVLEMSTKASVGIFVVVVVEALIPLLVTCMVIEWVIRRRQYHQNQIYLTFSSFDFLVYIFFEKVIKIL